MKGASIFSYGHIFDIMEAVLDGPMSSLELEQTLRDGDGGREAAHPVTNVLVPLPLRLPSTTNLKDLLQTRPIGVAFKLARDPNTSDLQTSMSLVGSLSLLFR